LADAGTVAIPILWEFFRCWGSAEATRTADWTQIAELMHPLGLHEKRAKMLIRFSGNTCFKYSVLNILSKIIIAMYC